MTRVSANVNNQDPMLLPWPTRAGALAPDRLPTEQGPLPSRRAVPLPLALAQRLEQVSGGHSLLTYAALLAAVRICLRAHSGEAHVVTACPMPRGQDWSPGRLALIAGAVPDALSFRAFLNTVRTAVLEVSDSLAPAVASDDAAADRSVVVAFDELHADLAPRPGAVTLCLARQTGALQLRADFDATAHGVATIERFIDQTLRVLTQGLATPDAPIDGLLQVNDGEREQLLAGWWAQANDQPTPLIHQLIRERARQDPSGEALVQGTTSLTRAAVEREACGIAAELRRAGVGRGDLVAVLAERGLGFPIAILATLKAGAAFVPIDPQYPAARIHLMLAGVTAALAEPGCGDVAAAIGLPVVALRLSPQDVDTPVPVDVEVDPSDAAYVIYTSGSTGTPKGVVVAHRGLANLAHVLTAAPIGLGPHSRVLQFAPITVDAAIWDVLGTLAVGATLCVAEAGAVLPGPALLETLRATRATNITLPPSSLALMDPAQAPASLALVVVAGEACPADLAAPWCARYRIVNAYGPTEATVCVTVAALDGRDVQPPIGRAIPAARACVVDRQLNLVPPGLPGELCVGGIGVARGYLAAAAATAAAFVPDPFASEAGARLYRTGDLVRQRGDGQFEFLGRRDHQVKVRGFRIDTLEIEAELRRHSSVSHAVVAVAGRGSDAHIVAYVVPSERVEPDDLQAYLATRLPEPMRPSGYMFLERLPILPGGKLDRKALPAWQPSASRAPRAGRGWKTAAEELVASQWSSVLSQAPRDTSDDFFALGGQSLTAIRVMAKVNRVFGVELPPSAIFETRTVGALARRALEARRSDAQPCPVVTRRRPALAAPLSAAQQRLWFQQELDPDSPLYTIAGALVVRGELDIAALGRSLAAIVERHEIWRTVFPIVDGQPAQVVAAAPTGGLPVVDLSLIGDGVMAHAADLVRTVAAIPFRLAETAPLRWLLLRVAPHTHVFAMAVHHIVFDAGSMDVFARELNALYASHVRGRDAGLRPVALQYADFACWQHDALQPTLAADLRYWTQQLADVPDLRVPTDRPRPAQPTFGGAAHVRTIGADVVEEIERIGRKLGATLHMTCVAVFAGLLHRYSGQDVVAIGTSVTGRDRPEIADLIGFFLNTIVIRAAVDTTTTLEALVAQVRDTALAGYAHASAPFERVVAARHASRSDTRQPLYSATVNLTDGPECPVDLVGTTCEPFPLDQTTAKFDLELLLARTGTSLECRLVYATDLFDGTTAAAILDDVESWLQQVAVDPSRSVAALSVQGPVETPERFAFEAAADVVGQPNLMGLSGE